MVFVLDSSDSVDQDTWLKTKQYVLKMTSTMKVSSQDVRIGLLNAGPTTSTILKLSDGTSKSTITEKLSVAVKQQGQLDLDSAIRETAKLFDNNNNNNNNNNNRSPKVAVLITKGEASTLDESKLEKYVSELKAKDVVLKVIRISKQDDPNGKDKGGKDGKDGEESNKDDGDKVVVVVKDVNELPSTISDISKTIADTSGVYDNIQKREKRDFFFFVITHLQGMMNTYFIGSSFYDTNCTRIVDTRRFLFLPFCFIFLSSISTKPIRFTFNLHYIININVRFNGQDEDTSL